MTLIYNDFHDEKLKFIAKIATLYQNNLPFFFIFWLKQYLGLFRYASKNSKSLTFSRPVLRPLRAKSIAKHPLADAKGFHRLLDELFNSKKSL